MKKSTVYLIIGIVLGTLLVTGGTYAYFSAVANSRNNRVTATSYKYDVIYSGGQISQRDLELAVDRNGGYDITVDIKMGPGSALPKSSLYLDIYEISNNLLLNGDPWQKALKWEVEGFMNNEMIYSKSGDFTECSTSFNKVCAAGDKLYFVTDYQLSYTNTKFKIYVWLDAEIADNGVIGANIMGYVAATTEEFSGDLS